MIRVEGSLSDLWNHYTQLSERGKKLLCKTAKRRPIIKEGKVIGVITQASYKREKWIGYIYDDVHMEIDSNFTHIHSVRFGKERN